MDFNQIFNLYFDNDAEVISNGLHYDYTEYTETKYVDDFDD